MMNGTKRGRLAILVGGGPAPGINGVISAATIEGINQGFKVLGLRDGYKWLAQGDTEHTVRLTIEGVKGIHLRGGSILGTSRTNPTKSETSMRNVLSALEELGIVALVSIGGGETALFPRPIFKQPGRATPPGHVPHTPHQELSL